MWRPCVVDDHAQCRPLRLQCDRLVAGRQLPGRRRGCPRGDRAPGGRMRGTAPRTSNDALQPPLELTPGLCASIGHLGHGHDLHRRQPERGPLRPMVVCGGERPGRAASNQLVRNQRGRRLGRRGRGHLDPTGKRHCLPARRGRPQQRSRRGRCAGRAAARLAVRTVHFKKRRGSESLAQP